MERGILLINKDEIIDKGERIYAAIRSELELEHKGEIAAIEPESGDYFLGKSVIEAIDKAREKYPDKVFHVVRIGFPALHVFK
ncbi:MAG: hypothetical protein U9Q78_08920 [Chloroflexota bacterium]|nr:hypothetical protein [Chloroflexota bacterium]